MCTLNATQRILINYVDQNSVYSHKRLHTHIWIIFIITINTVIRIIRMLFRISLIKLIKPLEAKAVEFNTNNFSLGYEVF